VPNKVLIVEDDPTLCEFIREVLSSADLDAHALTDSTQAAAHLKREKFNAVFLDLRMPPPDGIELTRQMRASSLHRTTPIIIITGEQERGLTARAFEAGASFLLFKPVDRTRLLRFVKIAQSWIDHERRQHQRFRVACKASVMSGSDHLDGRTLDVSAKGILLQLNTPLVMGSSISMTIELKPTTPPVVATARVVRSIGKDCFGLELDSMSPADRDRWHQFLLPLAVC
jgi:two-component system chemotaxis response regulator CheY